ncbi:hypothetical protein [Reticulibacter mediterranei]|uniref:hypothetical protein n=1 Tax=Reticulibacter mediterranei TaxID=2778369 RepID=UPI001C689D1E|nr:hypothetical protein [Reticulibacter mediterranei]
MQYPRFRRDGWPIGSGMVESANKNIVEARLKGPGMHWQGNYVNPMLALRNAVCNDRWQEMRQKALGHYRKLQALRRKTRSEQQAQAFLAVSDAPTPQPPAPSQSPSEAAAPAAVSVVKSGSCRLSSRRKQHTARNRGKYSRHKSGEMSSETCVCGTPLTQLIGGRARRYYSNACRQRAYRERQYE